MSTARRGKGEGTISQRSDGRWQARVDIGRGDDGRRRRKTVYGTTRQAVATKLAKLLGQSSTGELLTTSTPTVASWLDDWFATHRDEWRQGTRRVYRCAIDEWIVPALGPVRLEKLKPTGIQRWVNDATKDGAREKMVIAHCVLRSALKWAMHQRVLTYNAAALVKVPRPIRKPITPLTAEQGRALLDAVAPHRLGAMVTIAFSMGLRMGEVSGLSWADVDLDGRTLHVRQQVQDIRRGELTIEPLKTANSRRSLTLPAIAVDALKARRPRQLQERLRAGETWANRHDLVFTTLSGRLLSPSVVRKTFYRLLKGAGLDRIKFHVLRHSAATLLLTDGVPLFDVSRVLGHAQISTTSDIYGHLVSPMTAGAAARMDNLLKKKA